jgi:hypothetical protein
MGFHGGSHGGNFAFRGGHFGGHSFHGGSYRGNLAFRGGNFGHPRFAGHFRHHRHFGIGAVGLGLGLGFAPYAFGYDSCWRWVHDYYGRVVRRYVCGDDYYSYW